MKTPQERYQNLFLKICSMIAMPGRWQNNYPMKTLRIRFSQKQWRTIMYEKVFKFAGDILVGYRSVDHAQHLTVLKKDIDGEWIIGVDYIMDELRMDSCVGYDQIRSVYDALFFKEHKNRYPISTIEDQILLSQSNPDYAEDRIKTEQEG